MRPKLSDLYTLSQSNLLENHTLHSGMAVSPPPPAGDLYGEKTYRFCIKPTKMKGFQ